MIFRFFLILLSFFYFGHADIIVQKDTEKLENFSIEYFYDDSRELSIEDIEKIEFTEKVPSQFAFGYKKGNSWFKLKIKNKSQFKEFILYLNEPFFEEVNLFESQKNSWIKRSSGLSINLNNRDIYDINPLFFINIEPKSTKTFYIQTYAKFAQFGEFQLLNKKALIVQKRLINTSLYTLFLGALIFIIIFNMFLYITIKDVIYLYYVSYIFFFAIFIFAFSGLDIYLGLLPWHYELHLSIPLLITFLILFSIRFLEIKKYLFYTYRLLITIILIYTILTILALIQFNPWYQMITALASVTYVILLYVSLKTWIMGNTKAKYYLVAMTIYTFTIAIMSFMINGWLENNDITRYAFLVGSFIEIVLFSLILANRFNDIQNEKIIIQNELLGIKEENELFLEQEVTMRTNEISTLLKDKELLLKEVFHRVKNNFQIVISMLSLEMNKYKKEEHQKSFLELINRIKSMSMVHQFLYDSDKLSHIQSEEYLLKIIEEVKKVYEKRAINIVTNIDSYILKVNDAMVLGVIANEVLNNSIKHHNQSVCNISLDLKKIEHSICLIIKDDGIGFIPKKENKTSGLGLKLIEQFSRKLNSSKVSFFSNKGTIFELTYFIK